MSIIRDLGHRLREFGILATLALAFSFSINIVFIVNILLGHPVGLPRDEYLRIGEEILLSFSAILLLHLFSNAVARGELVRTLKDLTRTYDRVVENAKACGLEAIYPDRRAALEAIWPRILSAKKHVLLMGVALNEIVTDEQRFSELSARVRTHKGVDSRFLILNPLTSPAVFRSILESDRPTIERYIRQCETNAFQEAGAAFTDTTLISDCSLAYSKFNYPHFVDRVKFYRHDPSVWMVIVDDHVFVESYTFGRPMGSLAATYALRLGGELPVFEYVGEQEKTFKILRDHFERLWMSTEDDLFHMGLQYKNKEHILDVRVFRRRFEWFKMVCQGLRGDYEKRRSVRQRYDCGLTMITSHGQVPVQMYDLSQEGLAVIADRFGSNIRMGEVVTFQVDPNCRNPDAEFARNFFTEQRGSYHVVRKAGGSNLSKEREIVGLKRAA